MIWMKTKNENNINLCHSVQLQMNKYFLSKATRRTKQKKKKRKNILRCALVVNLLFSKPIYGNSRRKNRALQFPKWKKKKEKIQTRNIYKLLINMQFHLCISSLAKLSIEVGMEIWNKKTKERSMPFHDHISYLPAIFRVR